MLDVPNGLSKREASDWRKALIIQRLRYGMAPEAIARQYDVTKQYVSKVKKQFILDVVEAKERSERGRRNSPPHPKVRKKPVRKRRNRNMPSLEEVVASQEARWALRASKEMVRTHGDSPGYGENRIRHPDHHDDVAEYPDDGLEGRVHPQLLDSPENDSHHDDSEDDLQKWHDRPSKEMKPDGLG